jgi:hypothetical protein
MVGRRLVVGIIGLAVVIVAAVWLLSRAYPTLWCSIVGTCNL